MQDVNGLRLRGSNPFMRKHNYSQAFVISPVVLSQVDYFDLWCSMAVYGNLLWPIIACDRIFHANFLLNERS